MWFKQAFLPSAGVWKDNCSIADQAGMEFSTLLVASQKGGFCQSFTFECQADVWRSSWFHFFPHALVPKMQAAIVRLSRRFPVEPN